MQKKIYNFNMADNNNEKGKGNKKPSKGIGSNKPDDNFDWSKIIRLVFGWGAVIIAAVIVMQVFRTGSANYVEIPYSQYEKLLNTDKIKKATITKSDVNDYYLKAELENEETVVINNKETRVTQ